MANSESVLKSQWKMMVSETLVATENWGLRSSSLPIWEQVARYCEVCMWDEVLLPIFDLLSKLNFFKTLCCNSGQGDHVLNSFLSQEAGRLIQKTWVGATGFFGSLTRLCSQDCPLTEQLKKREGTFTCYDKYEYEILSRELMKQLFKSSFAFTEFPWYEFSTFSCN